MASQPISSQQAQRNRRVGWIMALCAAAMLGLGYAAVPLYRLFCEATGFGGTPRRADAAQVAAAAKAGVKVRGSGTISVRFDGNVAPGMPWRFGPDETTQTVRLGQRQMATFHATNLSASSVTGTAIFNVTPDSAAKHFNKIQCFCFTQQTLKPGEAVHMPVIYYVDPAILTDPDAKGVEQITLSYTFAPSAKDAAPVSNAVSGGIAASK